MRYHRARRIVRACQRNNYRIGHRLCRLMINPAWKAFHNLLQQYLLSRRKPSDEIAIPLDPAVHVVVLLCQLAPDLPRSTEAARSDQRFQRAPDRVFEHLVGIMQWQINQSAGVDAVDAGRRTSHARRTWRLTVQESRSASF